MPNATSSSAQTTQVRGGTDTGLLDLLSASRDDVCKAYLDEVIKRDRSSSDYDSALRRAYTLKNNLADISVTSGVALALTSKLLDHYSGVSNGSAVAGPGDAWQMTATTSQDLILATVSVDVSAYPSVKITLELEDQGDNERPEGELVNVTLVIEAKMGTNGEAKKWQLTMGKETAATRAV